MHAGGGDAGNAGEPESPGGESFGGGMGWGGRYSRWPQPTLHFLP